MAEKRNSDKDAKDAFIDELNNRGYIHTDIVASPADITAEKDGEKWYFEIKKTTKEDYFGAATQTEWSQAFKDPEHFRFVIAKFDEKKRQYEFIEFTPTEFMEYSTIPPFKVYFRIDLRNLTKKIRSNNKCSSLKMTKRNFDILDAIFCKLKNHDREDNQR